MGLALVGIMSAIGYQLPDAPPPPLEPPPPEERLPEELPELEPDLRSDLERRPPRGLSKIRTAGNGIRKITYGQSPATYSNTVNTAPAR